jgi:hypothetical protein
MAIEEEVKSQGYVELLIVDPFLEGEHCTVVYLELALCLLEQSCHPVVKAAERSQEGSILIDGKAIEPSLDPAHEPSDMSLYFFVPSQSE